MDMSNNATSEHFLAQVERLLDWTALAPMMRAISVRVRADVPLAALKMLLLARWYGMNEAALLEACQDRISFRRFLGLPATDSRDDARQADAFRRNVAQAPMETQSLIHAIEAQLLSKGYAIKPGMSADAAVVALSSDAVLANSSAGETAFFHPGEMAKMRREGEAAGARGGEMMGANPPSLAPADAAQSQAQREPEPAAPATVEWPWGATTALEERLNIGREFGFSPVANELQSYRHISRRHAELLVCGAGVWVRDLHSHNRTFVNDQEVPSGQAYLVDSDSRIRFGPNLVILLKLGR